MSEFFRDKVVVITGGTDGIGRALIDVLVPMGAKIATCGRNYDKLYNLQRDYSNVILHAIVCDVSNEKECQRFIDSTVKEFGGIDILINNAGISMRALVKDLEVDVIRKVMDVNFFGSVYCTKFALPYITERQGSIIGVSSIAGYRGLPGRSGYSASKFALQGWLESLRTEMIDANVHVMWVCPGFTTSNIRNTALDQEGNPSSGSMMDEGKMMPASEVAVKMLDAIEKRKRTLVMTFTGKRAVFMNKFFPGWADKMVHKFFFKDGKLNK